MRFHSGFLALKDFVEKRNSDPIQTIVEWSTYLPAWHPDEDFRESYVAKRDLGGGVTLKCSHEIDMLVQLLGPVNVVFGCQPRKRYVVDEVDESLSAVLMHDRGTSSLLSLTLAHQPQRRTFRVLWEDESVEWDFHKGLLTKWSKGGRSTIADVSESVNSMYIRLIEDVLLHIEGSQISRSVLSSTLPSMSATYALLSSLESGSSLRLQ
jgi:predicted dehydrogenase